MTFRTQILAGFIAALAAPAITYASSSGLTQYDIEHGQTALLSSREGAVKSAKDQKEQVAQRQVVDVSKEQSRHLQAMAAGAVRMTTGDMEASGK